MKHGDKEEVNSKYLLEKCDFKLLKDLGDNYYKDNGYCMFCVNRDKKCNKCKAELWIKMNLTDTMKSDKKDDYISIS